MKITKYTILLFLVVLLGFSLRIWQLGKVPASPNWDEVALGYNAFSILHTGRDEYGKFLPAVLRSYDDYKPAVYAYFVIPFISIFGLNTYAVRFPAVLFATFAILAVYYLIQEVFSRKPIILGDFSLSSQAIGLVCAFLLAVSPWHIQFSRIAFESNVGVAFNIFAILFLLVGLRKPWFLLLSAFCFGITPSIYQSDKVFTPLLFLSSIFIYRKSLLRVERKYLVLAALVGIITIFPALWFQLTDKQALARAQGVSIFADQTAFLKETSARLLDDKQRGDIAGLIFDNRRIEFIKAIGAGYLSHFDLNWLFVHGDLPRHHAPFMGLLYLWEFPFVFIGMYVLLFGKFSPRAKALMFAWFFLAPLPASITSGVPHAVRTLNFLPTFQLFTALGLFTALSYGRSFWREQGRGLRGGIFLASIFLYGVFSILNVFFFLNEYFVQQNYYTSVDWQYGYQQAVMTVQSIEGKYKKIIVTNQAPLDQSYMFFLFYLHYPPSQYQAENVSNSSGGFRENHSFGKYEFRPLNWSQEKKSNDILYIGRPGDFPGGAKVLDRVKYLNGDDAILLVEG